MRYAQHFQKNVTPQSEAARADQVQNSAGGYAFQISKWDQLDRFLILGTEGGTYYATEQKLTRDNAKNVIACLAEDGARAVARTAEISDAGRAPKNDPAIFVLALAASDEKPETRAAALAALPKVARIGTHLFHFVDAVSQQRGFGPALRKALTKWYLDKSPEKLAIQCLKYQSRDKWSHKDVLRLAHGAGANGALTPAHAAIFEWVRAGTSGFQARDVKRKGPSRVDHYEAANREALPKILAAYDELKAAKSASDVVRLIKEHGFTREMVPTGHLNSVEVWEALLQDMPMTAMIRNLGKMTAVGLLKPLSAASKKVAEAVCNRDALKKARVHPIALLSALKIYEQGHGEKGKLTWGADRSVLDALNEGFYLAFDTIELTGKNWLLGIDVSGSMDSGTIAGVPGLTPRIAAAAMAMVTARSEKNWHALGFTSSGRGYGGQWGGSPSGLTVLNISPKQRLDDVIHEMQRLPMGGTDCALPMLYAAGNNIDVDTFVIYTDSETWAGNIHPFEALKAYRAKIGRNAKLIVVGFTATEFSIADPTDAGMMDVVGFDTAAPSVMADFSRN